MDHVVVHPLHLGLCQVLGFNAASILGQPRIQVDPWIHKHFRQNVVLQSIRVIVRPISPFPLATLVRVEVVPVGMTCIKAVSMAVMMPRAIVPSVWLSEVRTVGQRNLIRFVGVLNAVRLARISCHHPQGMTRLGPISIHRLRKFLLLQFQMLVFGGFQRSCLHLPRLFGSDVIRNFGACAVPIALITQLRKETGASIQKCKEALELSNSSIEAAIEHLRKLGENLNLKSSASARAGSRVAAQVSGDGKVAVLSKTASMTDFASESELFVKFSEALNSALLHQGSPALDGIQIRPGFSKLVHATSMTAVLSELSTILSEPVAISSVQVVHGDLVSAYVHNRSPYSQTVGSLASVVSFTLPPVDDRTRSLLSNLGNRIARQIAATSPRFIDSSQVPVAVVATEKEILTTRIKKADVLEKAFKGHMAKFYSDNCILDMEWLIPSPDGKVIDGMTVRQVVEMECKSMSVDPTGFKIATYAILK